MLFRDIRSIIESWAPKAIAWERDNIGIQVGSPSQKVRGVLLSLDITPDVIDEARRKRADVIISHHPLIFQPIKNLNAEQRTGRMVQQLHRHGIGVLAAHTNLDFTSGGVNFAMAEKLGIVGPEFLVKEYRIDKKVVVFVPGEHAQTVLEAMASAGAGSIGKYDQCSFQSNGTGTFRPNREAKPYSGTRGVLERVEEVRLEMIVAGWKLQDVLTAMKGAHPYEEVAYDVYDLQNINTQYGDGVIGHLKAPLKRAQFLKQVRARLRTGALRHSRGGPNRISTVAICGGSGSGLLEAAIARRADAFVTADIRYHTFLEADERIILIDAGHYETEQPIINTLHKYLRGQPQIQKENVQILASRSSINPVQYYSL